MAPHSYDRFTDGLMALLNQVAEIENFGEDLDSYIDPTSPEFDANFARKIIEFTTRLVPQQKIDAVNDATGGA